MRKFGIYGLIAAAGSLVLLATTTGCNNREASATAATVASQGTSQATLAKNMEIGLDGLTLIDRGVYREPPPDFQPTNSPFPAENFYNCLLHSIKPNGDMMRYHTYNVTCPRGKTLNLKRSSNFLGQGEAANMEKFARYAGNPGGDLQKGCVLGMEQSITPDIAVYEVICTDDSDVFDLWKASDFRIDPRLESRFASIPL